MPMTFEWERGTPRCTIRLTGRIVLGDLTAGIHAQADAGAWTCQTVIDTTGATGIDTHYPDIATVSSTIQRVSADHDLPPRGPVVIVVDPSNSVIYGMARMYEATAARDLRLRLAIVSHLSAVDAAFAALPR